MVKMDAIKNCGIYCIENINNKKKYIGQSKNISKRWKEHKRALKNNNHYSIYLQHSYNKYGFDAFLFSVLELCDEAELADKELSYIQKFKTTNSKYGYNLSASKQKGVLYNKEYLKKMRDVQYSKPIIQIDLWGTIINYWSGGCRHASKELNYTQTAIWHCCNHDMYTYNDYIWIYEEEYNSDNFDLEYYLKHRLKKRVVQLDIQYNVIKIWETIRDASLFLNLDPSAITRVCRHKLGSIGGYLWEYEENYLNNNLNKIKHKLSKPVVQLDANNNFIKVWNKIGGIAKSLGFKKDNGGIKKCCENLVKTCYGYRWIYLNDYENGKRKYISNIVLN
jgi:group I intron endonuclease